MIDHRWAQFKDRGRSPRQFFLLTCRSLLTMGLVLIVMTGCSASILPSTDGSHAVSVTSLTQSDNGKSIRIRVGNLVVIQLRENPTTGYQWTFNQSNEQVLTFQGIEYTPSAATGVGGGGQRVFRFKGEQAGTTELDFKLWRQWQGEQSAIERFTTTVQVEG